MSGKWGPGTTSRSRAVARLVGLVLFVVAAFAVLAATGPISVERARDLGEGIGPVPFVVVSALLSVAFFPGPLLAGAAGLLFGTALGTPVSIASATLGAVLGCALSRWVAAEPVQRLGGPRLLATRDWVTRRGFTGVLLLRLAPGIPYNLVNYCVGLTRIRVSVFALGTAVGTAPRSFAYTALGGQFGAGSLGSWEAVVALAVLVGMAAVGIAVGARDPELRALLRLRRRRTESRDTPAASATTEPADTP